MSDDALIRWPRDVDTFAFVQSAECPVQRAPGGRSFEEGALFGIDPTVRYRNGAAARMAAADRLVAAFDLGAGTEALSVASPFHEREARSRASFCAPSSGLASIPVHAFAFRDTEDFCLVLVGLDRCAAAAMVLPARRVVVLFGPTEAVRTFNRQCVLDIADFARRHPRHWTRRMTEPPAGTALICSSFHFAHHLWNELSAVQRHLSVGSAMTHVFAKGEPLGRIETLVTARQPFAISRYDTHDQLYSSLLASEHFIPLSGSLRLRAEIPASVLAAAEGRYPDTARQVRAVKARHQPIVTLTLRGQDRTPTNQVEAIRRVIEGLLTTGADPLFILDGVCFPEPVTPHRNAETDRLEAIIGELRNGLPAGTTTVSTNGMHLLESFLWVAAADFYVAHHGSLQHKAAWFSGAPGIVHAGENVAGRESSFVPLFCADPDRAPDYVYGPIDAGSWRSDGIRADLVNYDLDPEAFSNRVMQIFQRHAKRRATAAA